VGGSAAENDSFRSYYFVLNWVCASPALAFHLQQGKKIRSFKQQKEEEGIEVGVGWGGWGGGGWGVSGGRSFLGLRENGVVLGWRA